MDLVNMGHDIVQNIPELHDTFFSFSASLGKLVFAARMDKKLTQKELADKSGVAVKTIHRIEGGSGGVTDKTYQKVFTALKLSQDDLAEAFKKTPNKVLAKV
ncbi:helix-turn-helix domain-containing protein [Niallia sp. FSL R7-0271]|uniref:helix-turn-helix domain-containing protein n=1 Tax=Niallia sp. FSL R7-0271 TaxID=2921678 RepID=UPI0030F5E5C7